MKGEVIAPLFPDMTYEPPSITSPSFFRDRTFIRATIHSLQKHSVKINRFLDDGSKGGEETLAFDHCVYALGASLPGPVDVWGIGGDGTKVRGIEFMEERGRGFDKAKSLIVVGGGALGIRELVSSLGGRAKLMMYTIELASDFKALYPQKEVTLVHSREKLMPFYPQAMHDGSE
jgi:hypothetical protein